MLDKGIKTGYNTIRKGKENKTMTKTAMINEMLNANYEPAYKDGGKWWFKKYGICEKTKMHAFNDLKYHTAGTNRVEKLYKNFKKIA